MANVKLAYSTATAITCTLTSLGATSAGESASVDNSTNLYLDALVQLKTKVDTGVPANDKALYVFAAGSDDGGTTWPDVVTGADAAITLQSPTQLRLIGSLNLVSASTVYKSSPFSVGAAFGGQLPPKWSIVILNSSAALPAVAGDHALHYVGVSQTVIC